MKIKFYLILITIISGFIIYSNFINAQEEEKNVSTKPVETPVPRIDVSTENFLDNVKNFLIDLFNDGALFNNKKYF